MRCVFCKLLEKKGNTFISNMSVSTAFLNLNQNFHGRAIVVFKKHATDIMELSTEEMNRFASDMRKIAKAVKKSLKPGKLNYAILGNKVEHLHWHIYPRYKNDGRWGKSPWADGERFLAEKEYSKLASKIRGYL